MPVPMRACSSPQSSSQRSTIRRLAYRRRIFFPTTAGSPPRGGAEKITRSYDAAHQVRWYGFVTNISNGRTQTTNLDGNSNGRREEEVPSSPKDNLPLEVSSFVGREEEMIEVVRSLAESRILTLVGAGGSGKTRLALRAARGVAA